MEDSQNNGEPDLGSLDYSKKVEEISDGESHEKKKAYTKLPPSDKIWVKEKAKQLGGTESEVLRRLVYQARLKDSDGNLIGL